MVSLRPAPSRWVRVRRATPREGRRDSGHRWRSPQIQTAAGASLGGTAQIPGSTPCAGIRLCPGGQLLTPGSAGCGGHDTVGGVSAAFHAVTGAASSTKAETGWRRQAGGLGSASAVAQGAVKASPSVRACMQCSGQHAHGHLSSQPSAPRPGTWSCRACSRVLSEEPSACICWGAGPALRITKLH